MDPDKQSLHLPAFGKDRKTSFLSFSSLGAVVLINALIWKSAGKITSGHIIKINR
jgi:hypothetical protein